MRRGALRFRRIGGYWPMLLAALALPGPGRAQSTLTQEEALRLAFPAPLRIERRTAYLDDAQIERARAQAGAKVEISQRVVTYYAGMRGDEVVGVAYFDAHRVRTVGEVLMIVVGSDSAIERIEILKFAEPPEYKVSKPWLDQFSQKKLGADLTLKRGIVNMTGATLSSNAVTSAARRVLALNAVIQPFGRSP